MASVAYLQGGGMDKKSVWDRQHAEWALISDDVALEFFGSRRKIFISSEAGDLRGFKRRFAHLLDITVYDGQNADLYLQGGADIFIYGECSWPAGKCASYYARQLYADMLVEDMRRYFRRHDISYYCCNITRVVANMADRLVSVKQPKPFPPAVWSGIAEDYFNTTDYVGDKYFEVIGGHRQDAPEVKNYTRSIFVFGPCTALGTTAPFGETIEARLQEICLEKGHRWRTVNCGSHNSGACDMDSLIHMTHVPMRRGDIVIQFATLGESSSAFKHEHFFFSSAAFDDPKHIKGRYFWNESPSHLTPEGNKVWGQFLAKQLLDDPDLAEEPASCNLVTPFASRLGDPKARNPQLRTYLAKLREHRYADNGAIVMNANPFTLGHLYLVQEARKQVRFLYIFVVEEEGSAISFVDRYAMVKAGCQGLEGVEVLPSGRYMISQMTFPEYFQKEEKDMQDQAILPSQDIGLFGEAIAPTLGITKRFVGEEPFDKVTRQYNDAMKQLLPDYGVELVEIPRKEASDGHPINATQVREWIKVGAWEKCKAYLPDSTMAYLREHDVFK